MAAVVVLNLFMALLSFVESAPRAYRLKASNAAPSISTFPGTSPLAIVGHLKQLRLDDRVWCHLGFAPD
jgi:hypothetical protein